MNEITLVLEVKSMLRRQGFDVWIFGGWAEELRGISRMRNHGDIDLLMRDEDFNLLDEYVSSHPELETIPQKTYSHKRAFYYKGVMIEVFLISQTPQGLFTKFFDHFKYSWPQHTFDELYLHEGKVLHVVSTSALFQYRNTYALVKKARKKTKSLLFKIRKRLYKYSA
ncbi:MULTISPECIES: nucleotidyltransferase domain-containing protein [unclassified Paraflavitalea]|uniref:nucleotidyltransferase domain-containing protein n=1 Tax=unclassified Paraflavitalea TaxID=2798305 RepID=UPI003D35997D